MKRILMLAASAALLTGCVYWPPERGGAAGSLTRCEQPGQAAAQQQICLDFCRARYALTTLQQQGAQQCLPAQWQEMNNALQLARQEFDAELDLSAASRVRHVLANTPALKSRLDYLKANTRCMAQSDDATAHTASSPPSPRLKEWQDQLVAEHYNPAFYEP